jgi:adenylate cyclase
MTGKRVERKLTAILSADVKGYSRLMGEDELATIETLKKYRELISTLVDQYKGRVVDSPGDNLLAEFGSVVDAVECAVKIQENLKEENDELPENQRMEFRIGVNLGDVVEDGERIYGDGVNIAARIEGLADGGGICISRMAFESVKNKLDLGYEYLGEHRVKNIKDTVGVYRLLPDGKAKGSVVYKRRRDDPRHRKRAAIVAFIVLVVALGTFLLWHFYLRGPAITPASVERMAFPLPDKPSIAVLPFTNMSGDPEQDYIGDGLSENIISALSISSKIFVIARNSTFTYKEKPVMVQQVAEELGVQYVLEGSIQKSGDRLRVTAQLINALTGHHLWTEVYNRKMTDLFDMQDEITKKIVVSIGVELGGGENLRMRAKSTNNLEAWKNYVKGIELFFKANPTNVRNNNARAREYFEFALKYDPEFASAWVALAQAHLMAGINRGSNSPSKSFKLAFECVHKALELDDQDPNAHSNLGNFYLLIKREHERAISAGKREVALNPNYAEGYAWLAMALQFSGLFDEAIAMMNRAYRLNPKIWPIHLRMLTLSYIFLKRYKKALDVIKQTQELALKGGLPAIFPQLDYCFVYQELGKEEKARAHMAEATKLMPELSLEYARAINPYKNQAHLQRMLDAYRKAGMPEKAARAVQ